MSEYTRSRFCPNHLLVFETCPECDVVVEIPSKQMDLLKLLDEAQIDKRELESKLASANERIKNLEQELYDERKDLEAWRMKWTDLESENLRLREALDKYGRHFGECKAIRETNEYKCSCGFSQALSAPSSREGK